MAIKKIIKLPRPSLWKKCKPVSFPLTDEVKEHIQDLHDTLLDTPTGLALASNQILEDGWQIFVVSPRVQLYPVASMQGNVLPLLCINPTWEKYVPHDIDIGPKAFKTEWLNEHIAFVEGCLSVPEMSARIDREYWVELTCDDRLGVRGVTFAQGLGARIVQHECDHLQGKLIYDTLPPRDKVKVKAQAIVNRKKGL